MNVRLKKVLTEKLLEEYPDIDEEDVPLIKNINNLFCLCQNSFY